MFRLEILHAPETQVDRRFAGILRQGIGHRQPDLRRKLRQHAIEIIFVDGDFASLGQRPLFLAVTVVAHHHQLERQFDFVLGTARV
ncbi:hypothetical protein D3C79_1000380 [compost metagenome]